MIPSPGADTWYYGLNLVTMDWVKILSCGDDRKGYYGSDDGDAYNGRLHYQNDYYYLVYYFAHPY